jgi:TrmH family RNA methyltransferase
MLSKNQVRFINSLRRKKTRKSEGLFLAEGKKLVLDLLNSDIQVDKIYSLPEFECPEPGKTQHISERELHSISSLTAPNAVLAIFKIPETKPVLKRGLAIALDEINDPGNLGTIIRLCDWFDIPQILCSQNTVDCYNPKVVQSSMGSLARVPINYLDLRKHLETENRTIYGTFMGGESLYRAPFEQDAILVMGNEANGISDGIRALVDKELGIPQFGSRQNTESLNVAMATAIFLSEMRRRSEIPDRGSNGDQFGKQVL